MLETKKTNLHLVAFNYCKHASIFMLYEFRLIIDLSINNDCLEGARSWYYQWAHSRMYGIPIVKSIYEIKKLFYIK